MSSETPPTRPPDETERDDDPPEPSPSGKASGHVVAGRYRLEGLLGEGGYAEVWSALDQLTGDPVAVKILSSHHGSAARTRREVAALRRLGLPGVVRLLDEGTDQGEAFLVMERVEGRPFPGAGGRPRWEDLAETTALLLETLARIHAAGIIHRDLKPGNVLVRPDGRPVVLDFGVSWDHSLAGLTREGEILGTPDYLAPEQVEGGPVSPATDLYAVGTMLYEALAGCLPFEAGSIRALLFARLTSRPRSLAVFAPEVPPHVVAVVDAMLGQRPSERPRSALAALERLGRPRAEGPPALLEQLKDHEALRAVLEAARQGLASDLVGAPGSGRTRVLREVARTLAREGHVVLHAAPSAQPFGSLEGSLGRPEDATRTLEDLTRTFEQRLRVMLRAGAALVADDADRLDPWSAALLARARDGGVVVRALSAAAPGVTPVLLSPLAPEALRGLFAGTERIFHLPSYAAETLWERTGGWPAKVCEEVTELVSSGLARWQGSQLVIERATLEQLRGRQRFGQDRAPTSLPPAALESSLEDLAVWVLLAWPHTRPTTLASLSHRPLWRVEAEGGALASSGLVQVLPDGRLEPGVPTSFAERWSEAKRREAHLAVAKHLAPGEDRRLLHLLSALELGAKSAAREVVDEARAVGLAQAREGRLGAAVAALSEALLGVRRAVVAGAKTPPPSELPILEAWVLCARADGTPGALDRVLYELCRSRDPRVRDLEALVRAALTFTQDAPRTLALAEAIEPFEDLELECYRQELRVLASRMCSQSVEESVLASAEAWASASDAPTVKAALAGWRGRLAYRRGNYREAARHHAEAAWWEPWATARLAAMWNAASARMEAFELQEAATLAKEARAMAVRCQHPVFEARAEWILRATRYRLGLITEPDLELTELTAKLGLPDPDALVCLNEAAVAWRAGLGDVGATLASRAGRVWAGIGFAPGARIARCLALACGAPPEGDELARLAAWAEACDVPGLGIQALGLLARVAPDRREALATGAWAQASQVPAEHWSTRIDVTSVSEALESLGLDAGASLQGGRAPFDSR